MYQQQTNHSSEIQSPESQILQALAYENPEVVERFKDKLGLNSDQAEELFIDVKKFLLVCAAYNGPESISPTQKIDAGWHEFLLYTQDYQHFCETHFGKFIHHQPKSYLFKEASCRPLRYVAYVIAEEMFGTLGPNWGTSANEVAKCGNKDCSRSTGPHKRATQ